MNNIIHETAIVDARVELGENNYIGPYSVIIGPTIIGSGNWIGPHVTIGTPGQDTRNPRYDSSNSRIEIGNDCIIREYTAIQKPCYRDVTKLMDRVFLMQSVHVPHDAILYEDVVVTPMVVMGGIVSILPGANLAVGCSVHQYSVIGDYSIAAMGSAITKNIKPFSKYVPGRPLSVNNYAVKKYGFEKYSDEIEGYVLHDMTPQDPNLFKIIERYRLMSEESGRFSYE